MLRHIRSACIAALFCAVACGSPKHEPEGSGGASGNGGAAASGGSGGSSATGGAPVSLEVEAALFVEEKMPLVPIGEGDSVALWRATQGGHVLLIGARVRYVRSEAVEIRTRLRIPTSNLIHAEEARSIRVAPVPNEPDLVQSDIRSRSQVSHLPVCPNYDSRPVASESWILEVIVSEIDETPARTGQVEVEIMPTCEQTDPTVKARCECECEAGYVLGKCN